MLIQIPAGTAKETPPMSEGSRMLGYRAKGFRVKGLGCILRILARLYRVHDFRKLAQAGFSQGYSKGQRNTVN